MSTPLPQQPATKKPDAAASPPSARMATTRRVHPARRRGSLGANVGSALEALSANRLRSLLTALGVIVGVAAVIGAVTLTQGTSAAINSRFSGLGTNTLTVTSGTTQSFGARGAAGSSQTLTLADATAIAGVPHAANVSPVLAVNGQLVYGDQNWNTSVQGVYANYQSIGNWQLAEGSWFTDGDESAANPVAVLGQTTVDSLFTATAADPVGQTIMINGQPFRVVGELQAKGTGATFGRNQDDIVYVPFAAAQQRLNNAQFVPQIQVQADNSNAVNGVQTAITSLLEQRHQIPAGGTDDFTVRSASQLVQTAQSFSQTLTLLLVGIAAISLIVGGIGIMNIMLVSVTERTREIGIRMSVGARRSDIRNQFLIEALTLSVVGGVLGIALGLVLGYALTHNFGVPFTLNPLPIVLAFGVSALIGVAFGFYPALRASRLDPIEALRTE
ncbi:MAG TPA: ABC transporter permease [Ktedonobacterales bacterium]|jgi:putative ABC transport system permease protein